MSNPGEKLTKVWTHTLSIVALVAAIVTIVSFFGFHPQSADKQSTKARQNQEGASSQAPNVPKISSGLDTPHGGNSDSDTKPPKSNGTGTVHLEGGFSVGQPMLTTTAAAGADSLQTLVLKNPKTGKTDEMKEVDLRVAVDQNHLIALWRKGARFVRGIRLSSDKPHIHVSGPGLPDADIPVDADGKLLANLAWPMDRLFTSIEYAGPLTLSGLDFDGGLLLGDPRSDEFGKTLPSRFSIDIPRPGEILGAIKGDVAYPTPSGDRYMLIQALSKTGDPSGAWVIPIDASGTTAIRDPRTVVVNRDVASLRIIYSKDRGQ